jgi:mono/diheme cytochrome c family protein
MRRAVFAMTAAVGLLGASSLVGDPASANGTAPDGAQIFNRCAACHTATGAGVPGAFPPLDADFRAQAATQAGRRYLALAVIKGLMGPISVSGKAYNGMMPAQAGLDDAAVAAVLNHVGTQIAKTGPQFRPFTAVEVARIKAGGANLTPAMVAKLRQVGQAR